MKSIRQVNDTFQVYETDENNAERVLAHFFTMDDAVKYAGDDAKTAANTEGESPRFWAMSAEDTESLDDTTAWAANILKAGRE